MEWKQKIDTNLGITIILIFAALFTIIDFYVVGAHIDGYPFDDFNRNTENKVDEGKGVALLSEEEAIEIGKELYDKASEVYIHRGYEEEPNNSGQAIFYIKNSDGSFSLAGTDYFYNNKEYPYEKLAVDKIKKVLSDDNFKYFCSKFSIEEYQGDYYKIAGDRGSNMMYTGTELKTVSISKNKIVFNAVSTYLLNFEDAFSDIPVSELKTESKSEEFEIVLENGFWRVNTFTLAY